MVSESKLKFVVTFLIVYEARVNVLFIMKVKIIMLIKWSYRFPLMMLTTGFRMVFVLWASWLNLFWTCAILVYDFGVAQTLYYSNTSVLIRQVIDEGIVYLYPWSFDRPILTVRGSYCIRVYLSFVQCNALKYCIGWRLFVHRTWHQN